MIIKHFHFFVLFSLTLLNFVNNTKCVANPYRDISEIITFDYTDIFIQNQFFFNNVAKPPIPKKVPPTSSWKKIAPWLFGNAGKALKTVEHALPENQIDDLVKLSQKPNGWKQVGQELGKMNLIGKYGEKAGTLVLEDAYLRIAVKNGVIPLEKAVEVQKLSGVKGLQSLLAKLNPLNPSVLKGRLQELEIGLECQKKGYSVIEFGRYFADGIKHGDTDLDLLVKINNKLVAIESKAYDSNIGMVVVSRDIDSLRIFCSKLESEAMPVFCFKNKPSKLVQKMLEEKEIECLFGTPEELVHWLDVLTAAL